eukprot:TRINITY_DN486_c0_g1_i1.p2 TRINITY_DN486_c0_g1~~TRINITY_DN486_c0_g1_i1.p2  ORF type:complete len:218 (+),score=10.45 TRINITY_DN486_c0_g1_i1:898-1551(+)
MVVPMGANSGRRCRAESRPVRLGRYPRTSSTATQNAGVRPGGAAGSTSTAASWHAIFGASRPAGPLNPVRTVEPVGTVRSVGAVAAPQSQLTTEPIRPPVSGRPATIGTWLEHIIAFHKGGTEVAMPRDLATGLHADVRGAASSVRRAASASLQKSVRVPTFVMEVAASRGVVLREEPTDQNVDALATAYARARLEPPAAVAGGEPRQWRPVKDGTD